MAVVDSRHAIPARPVRLRNSGLAVAPQVGVSGTV